MWQALAVWGGGVGVAAVRGSSLAGVCPREASVPGRRAGQAPRASGVRTPGVRCLAVRPLLPLPATSRRFVSPHVNRTGESRFV